ncbi:MAG: DUF2341 domain-containing protein, partial [Candidatus Diapherotrites archaeon]|nr:DUF2341 domain-containing protein [Candidatus Diapherotrites archaeon]
WKVRYWKYVEAVVDDVRDSNVVLSLYSDGNLLCSFDLTPGISLYDVSGCLRDKNSVKMRVDLYTYDPSVTPVLRYLKISWEEDGNIILYEPNDQYLFRNEGATAKGWILSPSDCNDVNAYLYFILEGAPRSIEEYNYDHFITRSADANVFIGDYIAPAYINPDLGYYYMEVNVYNPAGVDLNGYPVKVVFDSASLILEGKMREDCGDIRVVDENLVELNYWLREETCGTSSTELWVKLDIPAGGTRFYIYHGRLDYTSVSNPDAVFPDENVYTVECSGSVAGGICSTSFTIDANYVVAPYQPAGYGELNILMSGDFDAGGAIGDPNLCDPGTLERSTIYINGTCIGTYSPGQQDCTDDPPPNTPVPILSLLEGKGGVVEINADAGTAVNFDPGCGYYYHYLYTIKLKLRPYVNPEPSTSVGDSRVAAYTSAYYVSDALDTGLDTPSWGSISWTAEEPPLTLVKVYTRTSPDGVTWSDWVETNGVIYSPSARYIQYKVEFAVDPKASSLPSFDNLKILYYEGVGGWTQASLTTALVTADPNPFLCGDLLANSVCEPLWNITPKERGAYRLRMEVNSGCGFTGLSNEKLFYVFAPTQILNFAADKNVVAKGDVLTLSGRIVDELGNPVPRRTLDFYDEGVYIGSAVSDDDGNFVFSFSVPYTATIGYHTLTVKFPRDPVEYYWESEASTTVKYSSRPVVLDINVSPALAGIGQRVNVRALVKDEVGIDSVTLILTAPDGSTYTYDMNAIGSDLYEVNVTDTWKAGTYSFVVVARNLDGIEGNAPGVFNVEGYGNLGVMTEKNVYGALEDVLLVNDPYWGNPLSTRRLLVEANDYGTNLSLSVTLSGVKSPSVYEFFRLDGREFNTYYTAGVEGNAIGFNGGFVGVPLIPQLMPADGITLAAWIYAESNAGERHVVTLKDINGGTIYSLFSPADSNLICFALRLGTELNVCSAIDFNRWVHVAGVYDGSTLRLYVDGKLAGYVTATGEINYAGASDFLGIGSYFSNGFAGSWAGLVDELRMYPVALGEEEIRALVEGNYVPRNPNGYWSFDLSARDSHPYKENAVLLSTGAEVNLTALLRYVGVRNRVNIIGTVEALPGVEGNAAKLTAGRLIVEGNDIVGSDFTVGGWILLEANGGTIADRNTWKFYITPTNDLLCSVGNYSVSYGHLSLNTWYHVACSFDRFRLKLYVNGAEVNSLDVLDFNDFSSTYDVNVGEFNGLMDELRVYHVALSGEDVAALYRGENVNWGLSVYLNFEGNDWNDASRDWLVPVYDGGLTPQDRSEAGSGTPISGVVVGEEKRAALCN